MKTKKLMMLLLTTSLLIGTTTRVNVFAADQVNKSSEIAAENQIVDTKVNETTNTTKAAASTTVAATTKTATTKTATTTNTTAKTSNTKNTTVTKTSTTKNATTKAKTTKVTNTTKATAKKASTEANYTQTDLRILTGIIYCEAGYQNYDAKLGVANVILNRVKSDVFDHVNSVKEAVYDLKRWGRQFSPSYVKDEDGNWTTEGSPLEKAMKLYVNGDYSNDAQKKMMAECEEAAIAALEGENNIGDALYFNGSVSSTKAMCKKNNKSYTVIDSCIFY